MISIVNPDELEQVLRPTVYVPSGGVADAGELRRDVGDQIRAYPVTRADRRSSVARDSAARGSREESTVAI